MVALNDLTPDKQWDVARWRSIRGQLEDWGTLAIVLGVAITLRVAPSYIPIPQSQSTANSPNYELFTDHLIDDTPPNSYDFTLIDPRTDSVSVPVPAPCDGKISETRTNDPGGYGLFAEVQCQSGKYWFFAHLETVEVAIGDVVTKGESLGIQGSSGNSTAEHIHLEIADSSGGTAIARDESQPLVDDYLAWLEGHS